MARRNAHRGETAQRSKTWGDRKGFSRAELQVRTEGEEGGMTDHVIGKIAFGPERTLGNRTQLPTHCRVGRVTCATCLAKNVEIQRLLDALVEYGRHAQECK